MIVALGELGDLRFFFTDLNSNIKAVILEGGSVVGALNQTLFLGFFLCSSGSHGSAPVPGCDWSSPGLARPLVSLSLSLKESFWSGANVGVYPRLDRAESFGLCVILALRCSVGLWVRACRQGQWSEADEEEEEGG